MVAEQNVCLVRGPTNQRSFARLWNRYCTGMDDRDKAISKVVQGITLGERPPSSLKPFNDIRSVWVFRETKPRRFLGISLANVSFTVSNGRIDGAALSGRGEEAYDRWRGSLKDYSLPTSTDGGPRPTLRWEWGNAHPVVNLSYNPTTAQALVMVHFQD